MSVDNIPKEVIDKFDSWCLARKYTITVPPYFTLGDKHIRAKALDNKTHLWVRCWFDSRRWRLA